MTLMLESDKLFCIPGKPSNADALRFNSGFNDPVTLEIYNQVFAQVPEIVASFAPEKAIGPLTGKIRGDILRAKGLRPIHHLGYGIPELLRRAEVTNPEEDHLVDLAGATGIQWLIARNRHRSIELVDRDGDMVNFAQRLAELHNGRLPVNYCVKEGNTSTVSKCVVKGKLIVMAAQYFANGEKDVDEASEEAEWTSTTDLVHTASSVRRGLLTPRGHLEEGAIIPVDDQVGTGFAYRVEGEGQQLADHIEVYPMSIVHDSRIYTGERLAVMSLPDVFHASEMVLYEYSNGEKVVLPWYPKPRVYTEDSIGMSAKVIGLTELMFRLQGFDARNNVRVATTVMQNPDLSAVVLSSAGGEGTVTNGALAGVFSRYFNEELLNDLDGQGKLGELVGTGRVFRDLKAVVDLIKNPDSWVPLSTLQSPWFHNITTFKDRDQYNSFRDFLS